MKEYMMYECEVCGKTSKSKYDTLECEAAHMGLTVTELQCWKLLNERVQEKSAIVSICKNSRTEKELDDAIKELTDYELNHGINPTGIKVINGKVCLFGLV